MSAFPFGKIAALPRDKLVRPMLAFVVVGQLLAFWMLCSHQVRKAEVRYATLQVQRVAVADCLRYIPHATLNSCASRVNPTGNMPDAAVTATEGTPGPGGAASAPTGSAMPVSFR